MSPAHLFVFIVESSADFFTAARLACGEALRYIGRFIRHHFIRPTVKKIANNTSFVAKHENETRYSWFTTVVFQFIQPKLQIISFVTYLPVQRITFASIACLCLCVCVYCSLDVEFCFATCKSRCFALLVKVPHSIYVAAAVGRIWWRLSLVAIELWKILATGVQWIVTFASIDTCPKLLRVPFKDVFSTALAIAWFLFIESWAIYALWTL